MSSDWHRYMKEGERSALAWIVYSEDDGFWQWSVEHSETFERLASFGTRQEAEKYAEENGLPIAGVVPRHKIEGLTDGE
jgi:hypothetical protein